MPGPLPKLFGASAALEPNLTLLAAHAPPAEVGASRAAPDEATLLPLPSGCPNKDAGALPLPPLKPEPGAALPKAAPDALLLPKVTLGPVAPDDEAPKPVAAGVAPKLAAGPEAAPNPPKGAELPKAGAEDETPKAVAGPKPPVPGAMPPPKPAAGPAARLPVVGPVTAVPNAGAGNVVDAGAGAAVLLPNPKPSAAWVCGAKPFAAAGAPNPAALSWNGCGACGTAPQMSRLRRNA